MAEDSASRPLCDCHGEPKIKDGFRKGIQAWQCRVVERTRQKALYADPDFAERKRADQRRRWPAERTKERYYDRKDRGVCTKCQRPLLSESLCWNCLNYFEAQSYLRGVRSE